MKTLEVSTSDQLEQRVIQQAAEAGINPQVWDKFMSRLAPLRRHNERMYQHSLRVGLYAHGLARMEGLRDVKLPLFGGCGHDMGKCSVPNSILDAKSLPEDSPEFTVIRTHTYRGFELLKDEFPFTAIIAGLHHSYQEHAYGIDIDLSPIPLSKASKGTLEQAARLVAIGDFYDAITTRKNDKGLISDASDSTELAKVLAKFFPTSSMRIDWLLANTIH